MTTAWRMMIAPPCTIATWHICDRIMALPSQNGSDLMAKVLAYTCDGDHELPSRKQSPMFWQGVHELVAWRQEIRPRIEMPSTHPVASNHFQ